MKRIILLMITALLLSACALSDAAEDTAASIGAEIGTNGEAENNILEIEVRGIQCSGMTIPNSNQARITFQLEMTEDALKLGSKEPFYLYGGGIVQADGIKIADESLSFQCDGLEETAVMQLESSQEAGHKLFAEDIALAAQLDGQKQTLSKTTLVGMGSGAEENPSFLLENVGFQDMVDFQCEGFLLPGSSLASIIFIGELKDGQEFVGGGMMDTGLDSKSAATLTNFECSLKGDGRVAPLAANDKQAGTTLTNIVLEGLELKTEDGQSFLAEIAYVCGFNIGMPPT